MWDDWNFKVKILGKGKKRLSAAVSLFFDKDSYGKDDASRDPQKEEFTHWAIIKINKTTNLFLFREEMPSKGYELSKLNLAILPLPYKMDEKTTVEFLWNWFRGLQTEEWGEAPDCDGSISRECFCIESKEGYIKTALQIQPVWAEYHK